MPQTISKIGIKNSSGTGYDTRDIGAKGQNVEVGYDASGKIILDVNASTPVETKQLTKVLQDVEKNISDLENSKGTSSHAWTDADGVNYGLADGTHYGHIKVGNGLTVNSGKVDVAYGNSANTACQGNDSRLSNARKNPNAVTFSDGTTNVTYDGSAAKTVTAATVGAAPAGHTSVQATSSILGHVKTGTGITNNSGTISVSYGTAAGTACQGNDSRLSDSRTPKSHAATTTTYGGGNSSNYGHVKLTDTYSVTTPNASTNGANTGIAASAYALQQAYSTLNSNLGGLKFGIDSDGNYGYIKAGADSVTPFSNTATAIINTQIIPWSGNARKWTVNISNEYPEYSKLTIDNICVQTNWGGANEGMGVRSFTYDSTTGTITCTSTKNDWYDGTKTCKIFIIR